MGLGPPKQMKLGCPTSRRFCEKACPEPVEGWAFRECLSSSLGHFVLDGVILSAAVLQAERRACPERSRRNLPRVTSRGDSSPRCWKRGASQWRLTDCGFNL